MKNQNGFIDFGLSVLFTGLVILISNTSLVYNSIVERSCPVGTFKIGRNENGHIICSSDIRITPERTR